MKEHYSTMATTTTSTNGATTTPTPKKKDDTLVLLISLKGAAYAPFRKAWEVYANSPQNSSKSGAQLLRQIVADAVNFDLSTIEIKERGKADTNGKQVTALLKKVKEKYSKETQVDALALSLLAMGTDISDMFTPEQIARYRQMLADKSDPALSATEHALAALNS